MGYMIAVFSRTKNGLHVVGARVSIEWMRPT